MKITNLRIKNFKLFYESKTFKFSDTSIIVGNNGVGKSTILEALNLALTGYYKGKNILKILNQDLFNKNCVNAYLASLKTKEKQEPPRIEISVYFDSFAECNGDDTPDGSAADGFTFYIEFDERYKEAYSTMIENNEIDSLPIEYYQIRWRSFARRDFYNNKFIGFKGLMIDSDNFSSNNLYTSKIIKEFFDDDASVKMSQAQRKIFDSLVNNDTVNKINEKILENQELKEKKVALGVLSKVYGSTEKEKTILAVAVDAGHRCHHALQLILDTNVMIREVKTGKRFEVQNGDYHFIIVSGGGSADPDGYLYRRL